MSTLSTSFGRRAVAGVLSAVLSLHAAWAHGDEATDAQVADRLAAEERECGSFYREGRNPPSDYRTAPRRIGGKLSLVVNRHFTPGVRTLTRHSTGPFGDDLDYTLYSFPNHLPALLVMDELAQREKTDKPAGALHTIDCYYRRAIRYASDDMLARVAYADYLRRSNRADDALKQLNFALENAGDNGFTYFNIGLAYMGLKAYDQALVAAHRAIANGFDRPDLKKQLSALNRWRDPDPASTAAAPASAASTAAVAASGSALVAPPGMPPSAPGR